MTTTPTPAAPKIKNPVVRAATLGVGALAIMNVTAVVSLRGLPAEATYGLTSVFYYLFAAVFYFIFCFGMSRYSQYMERQLARGGQR